MIKRRDRVSRGVVVGCERSRVTKKMRMLVSTKANRILRLGSPHQKTHSKLQLACSQHGAFSLREHLYSLNLPYTNRSCVSFMKGQSFLLSQENSMLQDIPEIDEDLYEDSFEHVLQEPFDGRTKARSQCVPATQFAYQTPTGGRSMICAVISINTPPRDQRPAYCH